MRVVENHIFRLRDDIVYAIFEEGGVVYNLEDRISHVINQTGASILELLDGERSFGEVVQIFARRYEQQEEIIREDIAAFLMGLVERGWVYVR